MDDPRDALIFALDVDDLDQARAWSRRLRGTLRRVKVGARLFCAEGPPVVEALRRDGYQVFLDLKFHDIPAQVRGACREAASLGAAMLTVHTTGGAAMMAAAVEGAREGAAAAGEPEPVILGVTVLTSLDAGALAAVGMPADPAAQVRRLASLAAQAGVTGVVCSPREVAELRASHPAPFRLLTPGIRPAGAAADDQARTATAAAAVQGGADFLVVGRPIRAAADPVAAASALLEEMASA